MRHFYAIDAEPWHVPKTLVRAFRIEAEAPDGTVTTVFREENNRQRLVRVPIPCEARAVRLVPESTWGSEAAHVFAFEVR